MLVKTRELYGMGLDYAVMTLEKPKNSFEWFMKYHDSDTFAYSSNWQLAGPIIEREKLQINTLDNGWESWRDAGSIFVEGETPLIAAMRCYALSKMGDNVEIPDDLLT